MAVPSARMSGASVAKVAVLSGTNTSPRPMPWMMPGQTMSLRDSTSVYWLICHSENAVSAKPAVSSRRTSTLPTSLPTTSMASMVPRPLGAVTRPASAAG